MEFNDAILVTGGTGMVGARLVAKLKHAGFENVMAPTRSELNLSDEQSVNAWFEMHRPRFAFLIAAKVGGIAANIEDPTGFLAENLRIAVNQITACHRYGVEKLLFLGSTCIYPRECPQPMHESHLLTGPLEPTNEGYALAKISGMRLAQFHHAQFGMNCVLPMPCNIYGTNDHFDLSRCHVLSALVKRFCDAVETGVDEIVLWGSGQARREFIHVDDAVDGMLHLFQVSASGEIVNLGSGKDVSILELAQVISTEAGFNGQILWDTSRPDGMLRKCTDVSRLNELGFQANISLREGIRRTIDEYRALSSSPCGS
ncbi:MAG: GDP-L-fucose synthase family protein [Rubripirellula sp.]